MRLSLVVPFGAALLLFGPAGLFAQDGAGDYSAGKDSFMLGDYKKASEAFERAVNVEPANAEYALWLGRSFERRAETASFSGHRYAAKARAYFQKAVALDPGNEQALNELFDDYLESPGLRGEGYDKAEAIAKRIGERNPADGALAEAKLEDRRTQFDTLDEKLRWAINVAPRELGHMLDLARRLSRQGRISESEAAFEQAESLAPNSPKVTFARAKTYIEAKRNLDQARALLNQYLKSDLTPDDPSRAQAGKLLREAALLREASGV